MPEPIYVENDDPQHFSMAYYDNGDLQRRAELEAQWKTFNRKDPASGRTFKIYTRPTSQATTATIDHRLPPTTLPGRYRVETFVPGAHATSRKAIFTITHNFRIEGGQERHDDAVAVVDLYDLYDVWHPLGEFDLEPGVHPLSGRVRQFDLSLEEPEVEVGFGPVRWVPLSTQAAAASGGAAGSNGPHFISPVGSQEERSGGIPTDERAFGRYPVWAGKWFDVNPFLSWYAYGYHTGADLNLPGTSSADKGAPIYTIGDGTVIYAGKAGTWGSIVVIEHPDALVTLPDGRTQHQPVYSRYGHVEPNIPVKAGERVARGQLIAAIGLAAGAVSGWHLHFDICYTDLLKSRPAHWPNLNTWRSLKAYKVSPNSHQYKSAQAAIQREVISHYLDPLQFIVSNP